MIHTGLFCRMEDLGDLSFGKIDLVDRDKDDHFLSSYLVKNLRNEIGLWAQPTLAGRGGECGEEYLDSVIQGPKDQAGLAPEGMVVFGG